MPESNCLLTYSPSPPLTKHYLILSLVDQDLRTDLTCFSRDEPLRVQQIRERDYQTLLARRDRLVQALRDRN